MFRMSIDRILENVVFRKDEILEMCKSRSVLHLGFIQHSHLYEKKIKEGDWLHSQIDEVASQLVGVDYLSETVDRIRERFDYEVYAGDVMYLSDVPIDNPFDVIVCGELIEHLENPGLMLEGMKRFCHHKTLIIFTTPNPWARHRIRLIRQGTLERQWLNPEHTMWFTFQTLKQLLRRKGYRCILSDYYYAETRKDFLEGTGGLLGKLRLLKRIMRLKQMPRCQFDGLFFVASSTETAATEYQCSIH